MVITFLEILIYFYLPEIIIAFFTYIIISKLTLKSITAVLHFTEISINP